MLKVDNPSIAIGTGNIFYFHFIICFTLKFRGLRIYPLIIIAILTKHNLYTFNLASNHSGKSFVVSLWYVYKRPESL